MRYQPRSTTRVELEDNIYIRIGELAKSNAQLVEKVVEFAQMLGHPVATSDDARSILGLKDKVNF